MLKETVIVAGDITKFVGKHLKKILEEALVPFAWALITWAIVVDNPRGWAASAGLFIVVYLGLKAYASAIVKESAK